MLQKYKKEDVLLAAAIFLSKLMIASRSEKHTLVGASFMVFMDRGLSGMRLRRACLTFSQ
jgi:hypothetical protein